VCRVMAGRLRTGPRVALAVACLVGAWLLATGCPSRSPYGGSGDQADAGVQPVDDGGTPLPPPDAKPPPGAPDAAIVQVCGDGVCVAAEVCACPEDCGHDNCTSVCGDGWCQPGVEDCTTCPSECGTCPGTCGDGRCDDIEGCWTCVADCGECTGCDHGVCEVGPALSSGCDACTDAVCDAEAYCCETEWDGTCVSIADSICTVTCRPVVCGDAFCDRDRGENCITCDLDCECLGCEHSACDEGAPLSTECAPCVSDVCVEMPDCCRDAWTHDCVVRLMETCWGGCGGTCGDGICGADEQCCEWCTPCEADCGPCCGNGTCDDNMHFAPPESCGTCAFDCCEVTCGDGLCSDVGESCNSCPGDCGACLASCGDGTCRRNLGENCFTCASDCPTCP
jgi:hypothetical protein